LAGWAYAVFLGDRALEVLVATLEFALAGTDCGDICRETLDDGAHRDPSAVARVPLGTGGFVLHRIMTPREPGRPGRSDSPNQSSKK